jgi:hypothetical protein
VPCFIWADVTKYLRVNNRNVFFPVLEAGKFKIKVTADLVFGKGSFFIGGTFCLCFHGGRAREQPSIFYKGTNPMHEERVNMNYVVGYS